MAGVDQGLDRIRSAMRCLLAGLVCGLAVSSPGSASGTLSSPLVEEVWVLPLPLPSIAYIVHPAGKGPFPLVIMNHGVAMDPKERSFFPLVEFREAAFWFARRGYLVVAPAGPGYGGTGLDMPERGIHGVFFQKIGKCGNPNFCDAGLMVATFDFVDNKISCHPQRRRVGERHRGWSVRRRLGIDRVGEPKSPRCQSRDCVRCRARRPGRWKAQQ